MIKDTLVMKERIKWEKEEYKEPRNRRESNPQPQDHKVASSTAVPQPLLPCISNNNVLESFLVSTTPFKLSLNLFRLNLSRANVEGDWARRDFRTRWRQSLVSGSLRMINKENRDTEKDQRHRSGLKKQDTDTYFDQMCKYYSMKWNIRVSNPIQAADAYLINGCSIKEPILQSEVNRQRTWW